MSKELKKLKRLMAEGKFSKEELNELLAKFEDVPEDAEDEEMASDKAEEVVPAEDEAPKEEAAPVEDAPVEDAPVEQEGEQEVDNPVDNEEPKEAADEQPKDAEEQKVEEQKEAEEESAKNEFQDALKQKMGELEEAIKGLVARIEGDEALIKGLSVTQEVDAGLPANGCNGQCGYEGDYMDKRIAELSRKRY